jgi:hypothetical protein
MKPNRKEEAETTKQSSIALSTEEKTSATSPNSELRQQRRAIFEPAEHLAQNRLFFCYFSFGEAKEK